MTKGNPEVYKQLYSRRDEVTLANPFGPPVRGWSDVSAALDGAAQVFRDGEVVGFENLATVITPELAYTVEGESLRGSGRGSRRDVPGGSSSDHGFRREDGVWKGAHRHADPTIAPRAPDSVFQT